MKVNSCCGCLSVNSGIWIIGVLSILIGTIIPMSKVMVGDYDYSTPYQAMVFLVIGILLIIGGKKRKSDYVFPSLCLYFSTIVKNAPIVLIDNLEMAVFNNAETSDVIIIILIIIFCSALCIYAFMVINTLYEELLCEQYAVTKIDYQPDINVWNQHQYQHL